MRRDAGASLEELVFKSHVRLWLQTKAGAENVGNSGALFAQRVDDGSSWRSQRGLRQF